MATSKIFYAITKYDFGGFGNENHMAPAIFEEKAYMEEMFERKAKAKADGTLIDNVTPVKGKMVQMPNGRKAKLFNVGNEVWARYSDGSATKYEA
ncbi:hypothetical protein CkP1_0101 [Citrobacter phage CkP1]|nr:hypothetical protein CkP1_0101 [Citrobacter phage CkP1]